MQCDVCGQDNPPEARFCGNCGAALPVGAEVAAPEEVAVVYAGFWIRFVAALIDAIAVGVISFALSFLPYLRVFSWLLLLLLYHWLFIGLIGQTPGKMAVHIKVVNAAGDRLGLGYAALREILGKLISQIAFFIGFLWIAYDHDKQGWHDKIASTYVIRVKSGK